MLSIANWCRYSSKQTFNILGVRSIRPQNLSPILNHIIHYSDPACYSGCGSDKRRNRSNKGTTRCDSLEISYRPYQAPPVMDHDYKNLALKRPMSPHLSVVSMTVPSTMSILQRITGVILASFALALAGGTLFLSNGIETYVSIIQSFDLSANVITALKVVIGIPFAYHYFNGCRFCLWSMGKFISISEVFFTAKIAMFFAVVTVAVFAYL